MNGQDQNNFQNEKKDDENEYGDKISCVNITLIFIIFENFIANDTCPKTNAIRGAI